SSDAIGVAKAGEDFVFDVPRRPHAVEIESAGTDLSLRDRFEERFAVKKLLLASATAKAAAIGIAAASGAACARGIAHQSAQVAVFRSGLNLGKFIDHVIDAPFDLGVAGGGLHIAYGRQVMAGDRAGKLAAVRTVPPAVALLGFGLETSRAAECKKQTVGIK